MGRQMVPSSWEILSSLELSVFWQQVRPIELSFNLRVLLNRSPMATATGHLREEGEGQESEETPGR